MPIASTSLHGASRVGARHEQRDLELARGGLAAALGKGRWAAIARTSSAVRRNVGTA